MRRTLSPFCLLTPDREGLNLKIKNYSNNKKKIIKINRRSILHIYRVFTMGVGLKTESVNLMVCSIRNRTCCNAYFYNISLMLSVHNYYFSRHNKYLFHLGWI